ncbi:MAG: primosomal protein N' (replication factor Y) [Planctomycetota bacterium]|jgi:primosomal protein N' (replication factor Y)
MSLIVDVAVPLPLRQTYSYLSPNESETIALGARVQISFGPRKITGFVVGFKESDNVEGLKHIDRIVDPVALLDEQLIQLAMKMAERYICGPGEVLAAFLPAGVKKGAKGRITTVVFPVLPDAKAALQDSLKSPREQRQRELLTALLEHPQGIPKQVLIRITNVSDSPLKTLAKKGLLRFEQTHEREDVFSRLQIEKSTAPVLMKEQQTCVDSICESIDARTSKTILLHGVTGSGKTEVYLAAIETALAQGRGAIVLVPEISLTPQTLERFESRFGSVAVLHSHLTDAERAFQWQELREGKKSIAIGPRSAVFAPVKNLGLIILDEEHENTFKQQNAPRYHARDVAIMRAKIMNAVVILGSATPSLESYEAAQRGEFGLLEMPSRVREIPLPEVSVIDMRSQRPTGPGGVFSPLLVSMIRHTLDKKEQVLLFLNRRGFHTNVLCKSCGFVLQCPSCDIALTFYKSQNRLQCHHCGHTGRPPRECPECKHRDIHFKGFGTEMIEHAARTFFPNTVIARMDSETMRKRHAHEDLFSRLKSGEVQILIGTQMAAKGLDFPGITLIGVISADTSLLIPDFRAAERTFQLMTQVSGRAGRGTRPGRVLIQTYTPEHYAYRCASRHDFKSFAEEELPFRRDARYPPFGALLRLVIQGGDEAKVIERADRVAAALRPHCFALNVSLLGPSPCPLAFIRKQHRHHILLRADEGKHLESIFAEKLRDIRSDKKIQVLIDRDPTSMM